MKSSFAYYPGCTLHSTAREYDVSARLVCHSLGIELKEIEGWTCCGASSAHGTSRLLSIALPARELKAAEDMGLPIAVACALCYSRLKVAAHELTDGKLLKTVSEIIGGEIRNTTKILHLLQILDKYDVDWPLKKQLQGIKVACYYGCLLVRPKEILHFDDMENPTVMDRIVRKLGAETVDWDFKTECCGASLPLTRQDMVLRMSHMIISQAKQYGADCIAVACPMCHSNLDTYQQKMLSKYHDGVSLPVFYFTQLTGLALGYSPSQLLLDKHFTDTLTLLKGKGLLRG